VGFLIEAPTSFSSIEKLAKKWQMAHTDVRGTHQKKSGGHARFFPLTLSISSIGKCLNYLISGFQRGDFFKFDNTERKRPSQILLFSKRHRWAVAG